ncbi:MnmC family methyltransferase [Tumidithrix elongata RA019]|uniref:MnmC family methyltransferase n=1 Tax=Tumidithrix elongata BACA0141 TaxID=2716417 RepID=A0AAW9Q0W3_9CYAN|nr:MnmC family methyltransferase [Tumidithrix elongata RA019]
MPNRDDLTLYPTADGSITFWSKTFQEAFHSHFGAKQEAQAKFVIPTRIPEKANRLANAATDLSSHTLTSLNILDVCYGLGYNSAAAIESVYSVLVLGKEAADRESSPYLHIVALENNLQVPQQAIAQGLTKIWSPAIDEILQEVATKQQIATTGLQMQLRIGDARQTIATVPERWADAIFLDPFSPPHCPQLWTVEFMQLLANCLKFDGYLVTYSCAAAVRSAMLAAGLTIGSTTPVGRKSPGTIACLSPDLISPLSETEREPLQTRAAIPYRDPTLRDEATTILSRRQAEQSTCSLPSSSSWRKQRFNSA